MKYYIYEGKFSDIDKYNASSKARTDVEKILESIGYKRLIVETESGVQKNKLLKGKQFMQYVKNRRIWDKALGNLKKNDEIVIQYPLRNTTINFDKILKKYNKKIKIILVIHDLESLRLMPTISKIQTIRVKFEDAKILKSCNKIISHNKKMSEQLVKKGIDKSKIVDLEIFDYLFDGEIKHKNRTKNMPIIIAGNLSSAKAEYLKELKEIQNLKFNLYGKNLDFSLNENKNIFYKGAFLPEELINNLEGSFGLVWDGNAIETCGGPFGNYLKYNNPHKISLYLVAGIPVIVWKQSAMASFVEENKIGLCVDNLHEIGDRINNLTNDDYNKMCYNAEMISKKLKMGFYLKRSFEKNKALREV